MDAQMALLMAAMTQDVEEAAKAIEEGADVAWRNDHGLSPLHVCSAGTGPVPLLRLLLDRGAPVDARDKVGRGWSVGGGVSRGGWEIEP
jgi:ankyrin repeat protein